MRFHAWQHLWQSAGPFPGKLKLGTDGEFSDSQSSSAVVVSNRLVRTKLKWLFVEVALTAGRDIPGDPRAGQEGRLAGTVLPDQQRELPERGRQPLLERANALDG
jgi:hypothetical protein